MQHKLSTDVQQYANRRRRKKRNRLLGCVAGILVFCITYAALLPAISQAAPYISDAVKTLMAPTYEYNPSDKYTSYTYSDNDIDVVVQLPADSNVPKDAILRVTPIKETHAEYASLASKAEKAVSGSLKQAQFYDISFFTEQMEYIPVDDRAKVSINYSTPTMDVDSDIVVLHYDENDDNPITLDKTDFTEEPYTCEQELTFETDGFSVFAVVEISPRVVTANTDLAGRSFIIAGANFDGGDKTAKNDPLPVMTSTKSGDGHLESRQTTSVKIENYQVTSVTLTDYAGAIWDFEEASDGAYYIKNAQTNEYLVTKGTQNSLTTEKTQTPQEFRVVAATGLNADKGYAMNAVCIETGEGNTACRINVAANSFEGRFTCWNSGVDDWGNHLVLVEYIKPMPTQAATVLSNLAGKNYIIAGVNFVNTTYSKNDLPVLTADQTGNVTSRSTQNATYDADGNVTAITLQNTSNAIWTFEKAEKYENAYYIKNTSINGENDGYLRIENGSLTVGQKQAIEALAATNFDTGDTKNAISLRTADQPYYYVNLNGNGKNVDNVWNNFIGWDGYDRGNHLVLIEIPKEGTITTQAITAGDVNNLAGKIFVITSPRGDGQALTSNKTLRTQKKDDGEAVTDDTGNPVKTDLLAASKVTVESRGGDNYTSVTIPANSNDLLWVFESTGTDGEYNIKSVATGKYLHIDDKVKDGEKPLTISDDPQSIKVTIAAGNAVYLSCDVKYSNGKTYTVNYYSTNPEDSNRGCFGVLESNVNSYLILSEYNFSVVDPSAGAVDGLGGKKFIISAVNNEIWGQENGVWTPKAMNSTHEVGGGAGEEGVLGDLAESFEIKDKQLVSVTFSTENQNLVWEFEAVPGKTATYYIKNSATDTYLNLNSEGNLLLTENPQEIQVVAATGFEDGDVQNAVCLVSNGVYMYMWDNLQHCTISAKTTNTSERGTHFVLTEVKEVEENRATHLDGKTLAIISVHNLTTSNKQALTSTSTGPQLPGVEVRLIENTDEKYYYFDDTDFSNDNELWTFDAVDGKPGVYYIKNGSNYLNIDNGTSRVSQIPQEITVLSDTVTANGKEYEVVYFRVVVDGKYYYLNRWENGSNYGGWNGTSSGNYFILAEKQKSQLTFEITVDNMEGAHEWLFQPHFEDGTTTQESFDVGEFDFALPTSAMLGAEPPKQAGDLVQHFVSYPLSFMMDMGSDFRQAFGGSWGDNPVTNEAIKNAIYDPTHFTDVSPYWGAEYQLTHWEVILPDGNKLTDSQGHVVKFAPGTKYKQTNADKIEIVGMDGQTYELYPGITTFKANYILFSDILTFYVNHTGTVADVDGNIKSFDTGNYTLSVAAGHVYYPSQRAGADTESYDQIDADIAALFREKYDPNLGTIHIVLDGYIGRRTPQEKETNSQDNPKFSTFDFSGKGAGAAALQEHVFDYIRKVSDVDIILKSYTAANGEATPTLNASTIDSAIFDVKWYVLKNEGDSWHIDGVTVGRTSPIVVTKTFHGLEKDEDGNPLNLVTNKMDPDIDEHFRIGVSINSYSNPSNFFFIEPSNDKDAAKNGMYVYNGGSNPYSWTMSAILKQWYFLEEDNYDFDDYDRVSTVTVTNTGEDPTTSNGVLAEVLGGTTTSVQYNNYYTKKKTGMFVVKKVDSVLKQPLAGAEFTLYDESGKELYTESTNASGEAFFYNLSEGSYTLTETKAPEGFADPNGKAWKITVDATGEVIEGKSNTLYPVIEYNGVTTFNPLEITNEPDNKAVLVVKEFKGITPAQIKEKLSGYQITINGTNTNGDEDSRTLKLTKTETAPAPTVSADGLTYYWILTNMVGKYTVTESNYELDKMLTSITVQQSVNGKYSPLEGPLTFGKDDGGETAAFNITFTEEQPDSFTIQNSYSNDFSILITKADSTNQNRLSDATFDVYGDHYIATDYTDFIEVAGKTLYKLGTVITGEDGTVEFKGWNSEENGNPVFHKLVLGWPYALVETEAPDGYNKLTQPIYLGVINSNGVEGLDDQSNISFHNGVYSITVPNEPGYELPATGGAGTQFYTLGGLLLMAVPLMYGYKRKRAWKGGEMA